MKVNVYTYFSRKWSLPVYSSAAFGEGGSTYCSSTQTISYIYVCRDRGGIVYLSKTLRISKFSTFTPQLFIPQVT
jgi:hypothetical protein